MMNKCAFSLLLVVIVLVGYSNTLHSPFVFDDNGYISSKGMREHYTSVSEIISYAPSRFFSFVTLLLNYKLTGINTLGFHLTNILLHIISSFAVFWFCCDLLILLKKEKTEFRFLPFFAALTFAAHPIQTQAVTYIYQRSTIFSALFYLLSLTFFVKFLSNTNKRNYIISLIFAAFSFISKENSFSLPPAIILIFVLTGKNFRQLAKFILPYVLIAAISLLIITRSEFFTVSQAPPEKMTFITEFHVPQPDYLYTQFNVVRTYIRLLLLPVDQNLDYDYPVSRTFFELPTIVSFLLHALVIGFAFFVLRKKPLVSFGILFFYITLSVESSFISLGDVIFEHRLYLPSIGFFIACTGVFIHLVQFFKKSIIRTYPNFTFPFILVFLITISFLLPFLIFLTYKRNRVWADEVRLWEDTVSKSPEKARPHFNLAVQYLNRGQYEYAYIHYKKASLLRPNNPYALVNLGLIYTKMGKYEEAINSYSQADSLDPDSDALINLGVLYMQLGKFQDAEITFKKQLARNSNHVYALYNLGLLYESLGEQDEADKKYNEAKEAAKGKEEYENVIAEKERSRKLYKSLDK